MFSKIVLCFEYHLLKVKEADVYKIAFRTCYKHYELLVMPFDLTNASIAFMVGEFITGYPQFWVPEFSSIKNVCP